MVESKKTLPSVMCHRRTWPTLIMAFAPTDTAMDIWEALGNS
jgi:hypothetical protein